MRAEGGLESRRIDRSAALDRKGCRRGPISGHAGMRPFLGFHKESFFSLSSVGETLRDVGPISIPLKSAEVEDDQYTHSALK